VLPRDLLVTAALSAAAKALAWALRAVADLLDPSGWHTVDVHVDAGSPEQIEELAARIQLMVRSEQARRREATQ
jgi:hypothetical protein